MTTTRSGLQLRRDNPLPWLLSAHNPEARHLALRLLLDAPADDGDVVTAQRVTMSFDKPARSVGSIRQRQEVLAMSSRVHVPPVATERSCNGARRVFADGAGREYAAELPVVRPVAFPYAVSLVLMALFGGFFAGRATLRSARPLRARDCNELSRPCASLRCATVVATLGV
jgi:hypothetical protein